MSSLPPPTTLTNTTEMFTTQEKINSGQKRKEAYPLSDRTELPEVWTYTMTTVTFCFGFSSLSLFYLENQNVDLSGFVSIVSRYFQTVSGCVSPLFRLGRGPVRETGVPVLMKTTVGPLDRSPKRNPRQTETPNPSLIKSWSGVRVDRPPQMTNYKYSL